MRREGSARDGVVGLNSCFEGFLIGLEEEAAVGVGILLTTPPD